jgi:hypothetical protein
MTEAARSAVTVQPFPRGPSLPEPPILFPWKRPTFSIDV